MVKWAEVTTHAESLFCEGKKVKLRIQIPLYHLKIIGSSLYLTTLLFLKQRTQR